MFVRMIFALGAAALVSATAACATYHEDLMSQQQLYSASCPALAEEEQKVADNIAAWNEGSMIGLLGMGAMTALESEAGTGNSGSSTMGQGAMNDASESDRLQGTRILIQQLRAQRGC
jgi:hypothetical protein